MNIGMNTFSCLFQVCDNAWNVADTALYFIEIRSHQVHYYLADFHGTYRICFPSIYQNTVKKDDAKISLQMVSTYTQSNILSRHCWLYWTDALVLRN
jgi:hypothetical protein